MKPTTNAAAVTASQAQDPIRRDAQADLIARDVESYLALHEQKDLLRFITCGSVDDGKSSLIGRLLYESKMIFDDHLSALKKDSKKFGTTGEGAIDLALLVDGLEAEREQGITIDVAYRFFSTEKRKFIVADTPGHEQYTRNMATGASTADLAIVLVDARKGVLTQTRRHSYIVSMMGVKNILLAVNKMDAVGYDQAVFDKIEADYRAVASNLDGVTVTALPLSALHGDNIVSPSPKMAWFKGPSLMAFLEALPATQKRGAAPFRLPVQWVNRPNADFRGYAGRIVGGVVTPGMAIRVLPSGKASTVQSIVTQDGLLESAGDGLSITLTLQDEIDISRGDVICAADQPCIAADQFEARVLWMSEKPMVASRQYILQTAAGRAMATPAKTKYKVDMQSLEHVPGSALTLNEIGVCNFALDRIIAFEPYAQNRDMGAFILVDRASNETVAAGMITHELRRATNIHHQDFAVNAQARAAQKEQIPGVLWMTGLSGAGKSTIADAVEQKLHVLGRHTMILDGDNVRHGLNRDLGFTEQDRAENIRRVAEVAKLMNEAGLLVIVSFISPFAAERQMAKDIIGAERFIEIFIDTPLSVAEDRDVKGLYKKARAGQIPNFTGIGSPYEAPENPDLRLETVAATPLELADRVVALLHTRGYLPQ